MGIYRDNIRNNIIKYRKKLGLKQSELAEKLNVSTTAVSGWERGANAPDIETLIKICQIFKISLSEMYGVKNENLTYDELAIIEKYRQLDTISKHIIEYILDAELSRFSEDEFVTTVAARGNSEQKAKLSRKAIEKDLKKSMSTGFDD